MSKNVLITGGNKGIGLESTRIFLDKGYKVIVVARDFKNFEFDDNKNVVKVEYDLSDVDNIKDLANKIGGIDILVNNAGMMNAIPYDRYPKQDKERLMNVNLYAPIELITQFSKSMIKNKFGRIVNVTSIAGYIGHPDIWYGVSKAALVDATKSFAKILAKDGITVNTVAPGPVETNMLEIVPKDRREAIKSNVFLDRFAKPEEVAKAIFWLASECPDYINGVCIDVNNGAYLR